MSIINLSQNNQQLNAVDKLLQLAERKHFIQQNWYQKQRYDQKLHINNKQSSLNKHFSSTLNRYHKLENDHKRNDSRQKLKQLLKYNDRYDEQSIILQPNQQNKELEQQKSLLLKHLKKIKLRGFHSNMTFYDVDKVSKMNNLSHNLTFYKNQQDRKQSFNRNQIQSQRLKPVNNKINPQKVQKQSKQYGSTNIVYFKPNKSETIRQLLNQMKIQKSKNNQIMLNSSFNNQPQFQKQKQMPYQNILNDSQYFYQYEMKQMKKYKRFLPFRENQHLLLNKINQNDNIWKQRFRMSMQRKQQNSKNKKGCFKKLIVRNQ